MARVGRALVLADGDLGSRDEIEAGWPGSLDEVVVVIAADGGARHAGPLGVRIDHWVGDGDSLPAADIDRLRELGIPVDLVARDKDESDTELAVRRAVAEDPSEIVILGAFGGARLDHELANVFLLADPMLAGRSAVLLDAAVRIRLVGAPDVGGSAASISLPGRVGDLVSLLPFGGDVEGVRTSGLRYPLHDEPLRMGAARGLSNVRTAETASVVLERGILPVVETPVTLSG